MTPIYGMVFLQRSKRRNTMAHRRLFRRDHLKHLTPTKFYVLMQAAGRQSLSIVQKLIADGADVTCRDDRGRTALMHALMIHAEFPLLILDNWIREAHATRYPTSLSLPLTRLLLSAGSEYTEADSNGFLPTDYALLAHLAGAEVPEQLQPDPYTVQFCQAAIAGSSSELTTILAAKALPRSIMQLALHMAATRGFAACCTVLLDQGADANLPDIFGNHPLVSATVGLHMPIVQLLIAHGVTQDGLNHALQAACLAASHRWPEDGRCALPARRLELVRLLLKQGADPNCTDDNGSPLKNAIAVEEDCELVRLLLEYGADPTTGDDNGVTPIKHAVTGRMKALIREWLASSRNIPAGGNESC
jgi:ankyrin repeat protein